jgi:hypothetical protein
MGLILLQTTRPYQYHRGHNLTIAFSDGLNGCVTANSSSSLAFTTPDIPMIRECFNLDELFARNNATSHTIEEPLRYTSFQNYTFSYAVSGLQQGYNPNTNYSQLWYHQNNQTSQGSSEKFKSGKGATLQLTVYSDRDCHAGLGSLPRTLEPWIGWTCQSEPQGQCDTVPISIKSFQIVDAAPVNAGYPKCWNKAILGSASSVKIGGSGHWAVLLVVLCIVGVW